MNPKVKNEIRWRTENKDRVLIYNPNDNRLFITNSLVLKIMGWCNGKISAERISLKTKLIDHKKMLLVIKELKEKKLLE